MIPRLLIQRLNEGHLANCDEIYFPALESLCERQTKQSRAAKRTAANTSTKAQKAARDATIERQNTLTKALSAYNTILKAGQEKTRKMLARSKQESEVALGRLATFNLTSNISEPGARHFRELSAITSLSSPDLMPLNDDKLFDQLMELSREIPGV